jgi:hypothetical protein
MIDTQIIAFAVIMVGAICGVVLPYLFKVSEEGVPFDKSYIYGMLLSLVVAAFVVLPDSVEIAFKPLFTLFLAGAALEVVANKVNSARIKKKTPK